MLNATYKFAGISMYFKSILVSLPSVYAILCVLGCGFFADIIVAAEVQSTHFSKVLRADFRHRPPEMVLDERTNTMTSPLKDILEEAAAKVGYRVEWSARPFARSIHELRVGTVDIVPRTIRDEEREAFVRFLGPIVTQTRDILFLVKAGEEGRIKSYEDLYQLTVGVKRGTVYFERFNTDPALRKIESTDDENMARMFIMGRFDTMVVLDRAAIENAFKQLGYDRFSYADYRQSNRIEHYFGMSRNSTHAAIFDELNRALLDMAASGRVKQIYQAYGLAAEVE